jgi:hypothetical protein
MGSGCSTYAPPKKSGCWSIIARVCQPLVDAPSRTRPYGFRMMRNFSSSAGITSSTMASPYGPLFAEFTEYESGKKGVCCSRLMAMTRGIESVIHSL